MHVQSLNCIWCLKNNLPKTYEETSIFAAKYTLSSTGNFLSLNHLFLCRGGLYQYTFIYISWSLDLMNSSWHLLFEVKTKLAYFYWHTRTKKWYFIITCTCNLCLHSNRKNTPAGNPSRWRHTPQYVAMQLHCKSCGVVHVAPTPISHW